MNPAFDAAIGMPTQFGLVNGGTFGRARIAGAPSIILNVNANGAVGLIVDVSVFNLLRVTVLAPEQVDSGPIWAKVISTTLAIAVNWVGNRYWTFGAQRQEKAAREGVEFAIVSIGGMLVGLACLWFSREVLGLTSLLADNISSNVVGLALGTAFRFVLYRAWVFNPRRRAAVTVDPA